jgi:hypothetical protein
MVSRGAFATFLCLVLFEIYFHFLSPQPSFLWFTYDQHGQRWNRGKEDLYFQILPEISGRLSFNEKGERDLQTPSFSKAPGTFRILVLGTSLTIGWPGNFGMTEMLTRRMREKGRLTEVINCSLGNSNLATLLQTLKSRCSLYENVDLVVLAVPLNSLVDFVAPNSLLWGENYIDDPNQLLYFLKHSNIESLKFSQTEHGTPQLHLSSKQLSELRSHFNDGHFLYDHLQTYRWLANRFEYTFLADKQFLTNIKMSFSLTFPEVPSEKKSATLIAAFSAFQKQRWNLSPDRLLFTLLPTYQGLLLNPQLRTEVRQKLLEIPVYRYSIESPESFVGRAYKGNLEAYLEKINQTVNQLKSETKMQQVTWVDMRERISSKDLQKNYIEDLYHFSLTGHQLIADELARIASQIEN